MFVKINSLITIALEKPINPLPIDIKKYANDIDKNASIEYKFLYVFVRLFETKY